MLNNSWEGREVTLIRDGVEIDGKVTRHDPDGKLVVHHKWGVCYDRVGSKSISLKKQKRPKHVPSPSGVVSEECDWIFEA